MKFRITPCTLALIVAVLPAFAARAVPAAPTQGNPVPGIGIIVKKHPPGGAHFTSPGLPAIPADFFGPGSAPFEGMIALEGQCSHDCGGCDNDCGGSASDSRMDYVGGATPEAWAVTVAPARMYSVSPIAVAVGGVTSYFDVVVALDGQGPAADDPIVGGLLLPPGTSLEPGTSSSVSEAYLDVHCRFSFTDAASHAEMPGAIEQDFHLVLQEGGLPVARVTDGTTAGHIVLGSDGTTVLPATFSSVGGAFIMQVKSLLELPVGVRNGSWGTLKVRYR